jgi:hypothetical protein
MPPDTSTYLPTPLHHTIPPHLTPLHHTTPPTPAGDPAWFIGSKLVSGTISDIHSDCNFTASFESYNKMTAELLMQYDSSLFTTYKGCGRILSKPFMKLLGWDPVVDSSVLSMNVDIRTVFAALATAYQVNGPNTLEKFSKIKDVFNAVPYLDYTGKVRMYSGE